jgi:hypothetical protein
MQRLLFLSSISGLFFAGCGDDECGPADAPDVGLTASSADVTLTYGNLSSGANNDCPDPAAPAGVVSLTIGGTQMGTSSLITFCIPRPDQLADGVTIGSGASSMRIIDFNGEADGCTFTLATGSVPTGTASATGLCDNGTNSAGYALTVSGNLLLRRVCPTSTDMVAVELGGTVAVEHDQP